MGRSRREGPKQLARQIDQPRFYKRVPVQRGSFSGFLVGDPRLFEWSMDYALKRGYEITGAVEEYELRLQGREKPHL